MLPAAAWPQPAHAGTSGTAPSPNTQCHCPESGQATVGLSGLSCNFEKQAVRVLETSYDGNLGWVPRACSGYRLLFCNCCGFPAKLSVLSAADKTVEQSRSILYCVNEGHPDPLTCTSSLRITLAGICFQTKPLKLPRLAAGTREGVSFMESLSG